MKCSMLRTNASTDSFEISYGRCPPICISLFLFSSKIKFQIKPLENLCATLWSRTTRFPISLFIFLKKLHSFMIKYYGLIYSDNFSKFIQHIMQVKCDRLSCNLYTGLIFIHDLNITLYKWGSDKPEGQNNMVPEIVYRFVRSHISYE
jgi:hypothetical protein